MRFCVSSTPLFWREASYQRLHSSFLSAEKKKTKKKKKKKKKKKTTTTKGTNKKHSSIREKTLLVGVKERIRDSDLKRERDKKR